PQQFGGGFILHDKIGKWQIGMDYSSSKWNQYRFYGQMDSVQNSYLVNLGVQLIPNPLSNRTSQQIRYRLGYYFGKDYIRFGGVQLPVHAFTFGLGIPMKRYDPAAMNQLTIINLSFEAGKRGSLATPLSETFYRISLGLTMSDRWFIKKKFF
ncbi:MAG: hypothetical protein ACYCOO_00740, partial [Chitinophagaceae bacterium]